MCLDDAIMLFYAPTTVLCYCVGDVTHVILCTKLPFFFSHACLDYHEACEQGYLSAHSLSLCAGW